MTSGRYNLVVGFLTLAGFMFYGFILIYLRDFAPDKLDWVASYGIGKHFESRLAHVHGAIFALINIILGTVIPRLPGARTRGGVATLGLVGLLMPTGILAEVYLGAPPVFVLLGGVAIFIAMAWAGVAALRISDSGAEA
jgi:hypothetical protein